jgi:hypothetical protein
MIDSCWPPVLILPFHGCTLSVYGKIYKHILFPTAGSDFPCHGEKYQAMDRLDILNYESSWAIQE